MSTLRTPVNYLGSTISVVNTNVVNLSSGVNNLSTSIGGRFSTQSLSFITSNITLSNATTSPNYHGYAINSCNAGMRIRSDQTGQISVVNPTGTIAEILFDTTASGGSFTAIGSGDPARGAYWFMGGNDIINVGAGGNVSINNNFAVNTAYNLFVKGNIGATSSLTITGGGLQVTNTTLTDSVFYSTNLTMYNGNFLQSNVDSTTSYATFYSTAMTVHGSISTTGTLYCLGRLNTPNVANVSTLIVGDNIASTAKVSLDIYGSYRSRVQTFYSSGTIEVNGGNWMYANINSAATFNLPELDTSQIGIGFWMHKNSGGGLTCTFSTSGPASLGTINGGDNTYTSAQGAKLVSIICLGAESGWTIIDL